MKRIIGFVCSLAIMFMLGTFSMSAINETSSLCSDCNDNIHSVSRFLESRHDMVTIKDELTCDGNVLILRARNTDWNNDLLKLYVGQCVSDVAPCGGVHQMTEWYHSDNGFLVCHYRIGNNILYVGIKNGSDVLGYSYICLTEYVDYFY